MDRLQKIDPTHGLMYTAFFKFFTNFLLVVEVAHYNALRRPIEKSIFAFTIFL